MGLLAPLLHRSLAGVRGVEEANTSRSDKDMSVSIGSEGSTCFPTYGGGREEGGGGEPAAPRASTLNLARLCKGTDS